MKRLIAFIVLIPGLVFCQAPISTTPYTTPHTTPYTTQATSPYAYSFFNYLRAVNSFDILVYFVIFFLGIVIGYLIKKNK